MHPLVEQHRAAIAKLCRHYHGRRLEVFGSAARGVDFDPQRSDVDLLVEFDGTEGGPTMKAFFALRGELARVFGRPVDLVMAGSLSNPLLKAEVDRTREPVYAL